MLNLSFKFSIEMKNLKLFISLFVLSLFIFSFAKATDCTFDWFWYYCIAWEYCPGPLQCECDGSMINSWDTCSTPCTFDGFGYICVAWEYCPGPWQCECDGSMINSWEACDPSPTPPAVSCSYLWQTIFSGQTMDVYQNDTVPYTWSCAWLTLTCVDSAGIWTLTPSYSGYDYTSCIQLPPPTGTCNLPWGWSINSGDSVTAYQGNSVACGSSCISETRTCSAWSLDWSYTYGSCSVSSCGWWGWWWGGSSTPTCELEDLICVDGVYEEVDWVNCNNWELWEDCEVINTGSNNSWSNIYDFTRIGDISNSPYSAELNLAYLYAYNMWITDMDNIFDANMEWNLIRSHMAKMLVERAQNVMWLEINTEITCNFVDISGLEWEDLYDFVIQACQMWLMWLDSEWNPVENFDPYGVVTRAQFGTVLSRAIWGDYYNGWNPYYEDHLDALNSISVMNNISDPWMLELRWYVMLMLLRANQIIE